MFSIINFIQSVDSSVLYAIQSIGPAWYGPARFLSVFIGSTTWLAPVAIVALFLIGKRRVALEVFIIFAISVVVLWGVKHIIDAPRPYLIDSAVVQYASNPEPGMPSGHAFISLVIFGWIWLRHPKSSVFTIGAPIIILLIGLSRIFLGLHYPSQVIAGWLLGILMLWLFLWIDKTFFRPRSNYVEK